MIKEVICGIYMIQSKIKPERIYIGSSININRRWITHLCELKHDKHGNSKLQHHYSKYGIDDLAFSILKECSKDDLVASEQFFINSLNPWFNIVKDVVNPRVGYKRSKETQLMMSKRREGKPHWMKGHKVSEETKKKMSEFMKGIVHSDEARRKMSESSKGKKMSQEARKKMSLAKKGKKHSVEYRKIQSEALTKWWRERKLNKLKEAC